MRHSSPLSCHACSYDGWRCSFFVYLVTTQHRMYKCAWSCFASCCFLFFLTCDLNRSRPIQPRWGLNQPGCARAQDRLRIVATGQNRVLWKTGTSFCLITFVQFMTTSSVECFVVCARCTFILFLSPSIHLCHIYHMLWHRFIRLGAPK